MCILLRLQVKKLQESKREERKKLADEEAIRKIKQLDDSVHQLQRQVAVQKQVRVESTCSQLSHKCHHFPFPSFLFPGDEVLMSLSISFLFHNLSLP